MSKYGYTSRYSLADYTVTITIPSLLGMSSTQISIGGPGENGQYGSCVGEIKVTRNKELWTTEGDPTGSWVHNKDLNRTGTVEINLRQVSNQIYKLMQICQLYEGASRSVEGLTITVNPVNDFGSPVTEFIVCDDCMITKIPDQDYTDTAKEQQWVFTCGRVSFSPQTMD